MHVGVLGSTSPWIEVILLQLGNKVTTIEYNVPICEDPDIECISYFDEFKNMRKCFDAIVSFSSIKHSGLGRYGDPINPNGDLETMEDVYKSLKDKGKVILGVPVGPDCVVWNVHRVYGKYRLPLLTRNFTEINWIGHEKDQLLNLETCDAKYHCPHPIMVLQKHTSS